MKFTFDDFNNLEDIEFVLCNPNGDELSYIHATDRNVTLKFNDLSVLEFNVPSLISDMDGNQFQPDYYDLVVTKRLIFVTQIGWFQITSVVESDDGVDKYKSVVAESLQTVFKNRGFTVYERTYGVYHTITPHDEYFDPLKEEGETGVPTVVGQMYQQLGIDIDVDCINGVAPPSLPYKHWTVNYISDALKIRQRTTGKNRFRFFTGEDTFGYSWMAQKTAEAFEMVCLFDFYNKAIQIKTIAEATSKSDLCLSFSNFMKNIKVDENSDDITTVLTCKGDGVDISIVNPTGKKYIANFDYYMDSASHNWMSEDLIEILNQWKQNVAIQTEAYQNINKALWTLYERRTGLEEKLTLISTETNNLIDAQSKINEEEDTYKNSTITAEFVGVGEYSAEKATNNESYFSQNANAGNGRVFASDVSYGEDIVFYNTPPVLNEDGRWSWPLNENGEISAQSMIGTAEEAYSKEYYYFFDTQYHLSYCKLEGEFSVADSGYHCSGFRRYITYKRAGVWISRKQSMISGLKNDIDDINSDIVTREERLKSISDPLDVRRFVIDNSESADSDRLINELDSYWFEGEYVNDTISLPDDAGKEVTFDLASSLYESGETELNKICQPRYSFSLEANDFIKNYEFTDQAEELDLGCVIAVEKEDGRWYYPSLLQISFSLENNDSLSMSFANALRLDDWGYTYADLITNSATVSRQVSSNWSKLTSYSKDREELINLAENPFDSELRYGNANTINQEFRIDDTGILGRKKADDDGNFEPYQYKIAKNTITITNNRWEPGSTKRVIDKIENPEWDGNVGGEDQYLYGLNADALIGDVTLRNGQRIVNEDGTIIISDSGVKIYKRESSGTGTNAGDILLSVNVDEGTVKLPSGGLVTVTANVDDGVASHGASEIYELIESGRTVIAGLIGLPEVFWMQYKRSAAIIDGVCQWVDFAYTEVVDDGRTSTTFLRILNDKTIEIRNNYDSPSTPHECSGVLPSLGYFYVHAIIGSITYSFGLFYWDGEATLYVPGPKGYSLLINNFGSIFLYDESSTIPTHTLYIAKI